MAQLVLSAAHLYDASKLIGACTKPWPDMDFTIARENEVSRFVSKGDEPVFGAAKQFCLALGMTFTQVVGKARVRLASGRNEVVKMRNIAHFTPEAPGTKDNHSHEHRAVGALSHKSTYDLSQVYDAVKGCACSAGIKDQTVAKQSGDTRELSPGQPLQVVHEIFVKDETFNNFDLVRFFMSCFEMMTNIYAMYNNHATSRRSSESLEPMVWVNEILWDAVAAETRGKGTSNTALSEAGQHIEYGIPKYG